MTRSAWCSGTLLSGSAARWILFAALTLAACGARVEEEGRAAVTLYLEKLVRAYASSSEEIVDPLVGEQQALRLLGLIGVKRDMGLVLDARLKELQFARVWEEGGALLVETREEWQYADRSVRTGAVVGEPSTDRYAVRYRFSREKGRLLLQEVSFAEPPQVGRPAPNYQMEARRAHGVVEGLSPRESDGGVGVPSSTGPAIPSAAGSEKRPAPPPGHPPMIGKPPAGHPPVSPARERETAR